MLKGKKKIFLAVIPAVIAASTLSLYTLSHKDNKVICSEIKTDSIKDEEKLNSEKSSEKFPILSQKVTKPIVKKEEEKVQADTTKPQVNTEKNNVNSNAQVKTNEGKVTTFKSSKLGILLTFPADWDNKYVVKENEKGISVYYKFQHNYYFDYYGSKHSRGSQDLRPLFFIEDTSKLSENELGIIDGIRNVPKRKTIHGKEYAIGGPTDCLEKNDPDRPEVERFLNELPGIINNLKEI